MPHLFISSSVDGHSHYFNFLATVNYAAMNIINIRVQVFMWSYALLDIYLGVKFLIIWSLYV